MKAALILSFVMIMVNSVSGAGKKPGNNELRVLARTWGFLKYYHPEIALGKHDWDSVLIGSLTRMFKAKNTRQLQEEINNMLAIAGYDTAASYDPPLKDAICYRNYDISWISSEKSLSLAQKQQLLFISRHPYQGTNYYATANLKNDGAVFTPHEKPYEGMVYPDSSFRLLTLFRFWNLVEYFYPYKYLVGKPWDAVLSELIPVFLDARDTVSYQEALLRLAASINDSHGGLWPQVYAPVLGKYNVPFNFKLTGNRAVVTNSSSSDSLLKQGAVIESMNGIKLKDLINDYSSYVAASNEAARLRDMHMIIFSNKKNLATFAGYIPGGKKFSVEIPLIERNFISDYGSFFQMDKRDAPRIISDSIGYALLSAINWQNLDSLMTAFSKTKAIIFDMRTYPSDAYYGIANYFLKEPTLYASNTKPDFKLPGMMDYVSSNTGTSFAKVGKHNLHPYEGRIILLVDERCQSEIEWACMVIKTAPDVTVIGSQTAGADGNVTGTVLPGGYKIFFSGLGIYYPDGKETQRVGIHVDIQVRPSLEDIIENRDPLLIKALELLK
jgi:hypothetical protein